MYVHKLNLNCTLFEKWMHIYCYHARAFILCITSMSHTKYRKSLCTKRIFGTVCFCLYSPLLLSLNSLLRQKAWKRLLKLSREFCCAVTLPSNGFPLFWSDQLVGKKARLLNATLQTILPFVRRRCIQLRIYCICYLHELFRIMAITQFRIMTITQSRIMTYSWKSWAIFFFGLTFILRCSDKRNLGILPTFSLSIRISVK